MVRKCDLRGANGKRSDDGRFAIVAEWQLVKLLDAAAVRVTAEIAVRNEPQITAVIYGTDGRGFDALGGGIWRGRLAVG